MMNTSISNTDLLNAIRYGQQNPVAAGAAAQPSKRLDLNQIVDRINQKANDAQSKQSSEENRQDELDTGQVNYTYKKGDTFGQVLLDLGLSEPGKLWGEDGDVKYYTDQLHSQGIYGNIPIGTTISLLPRKRNQENTQANTTTSTNFNPATITHIA